MKPATLLCLFLLSFFGSELSAQKQKSGYINRDSLLHLIPGYKEANEALNQKQRNIAIDRHGYVTRLEQKKHEYDSLKGKGSALIDTLRVYEIRDMENMLVNFDAYTLDYTKYNNMRLEAFEYELNEAVQVVLTIKKCVLSESPTGAINLNADVASELHKKEKVHAEPKRIGYVNRDSLLRLIPKYAQSKDSARKAGAPYYSYMLFDEYAGESYSDSLCNAKLDSIHRIDSITCAPYELKYQQAWEAEMKKRNVFYISESFVMREVWEGTKVEFVSLNKEFAERLGL